MCNHPPCVGKWTPEERYDVARWVRRYPETRGWRSDSPSPLSPLRPINGSGLDPASGVVLSRTCVERLETRSPRDAAGLPATLNDRFGSIRWVGSYIVAEASVVRGSGASRAWSVPAACDESPWHPITSDPRARGSPRAGYIKADEIPALPLAIPGCNQSGDVAVQLVQTGSFQNGALPRLGAPGPLQRLAVFMNQ